MEDIMSLIKRAFSKLFSFWSKDEVELHPTVPVKKQASRMKSDEFEAEDVDDGLEYICWLCHEPVPSDPAKRVKMSQSVFDPNKEVEEVKIEALRFCCGNKDIVIPEEVVQEAAVGDFVDVENSYVCKSCLPSTECEPEFGGDVIWRE